MRIIFYGTPDFAVATLDTIYHENFEIAAVVTAPDKPAGRGRKVKPSPVKQYALEKDIPVLQPPNLKAESFISELKSLNPDVQVVVAFRMLPEVVWSLPPKGTFNIHASLLPQYRGAAPINHAIINGETETGVTSFFLQKEIDTGHIIAQKKVSIDENDNAGTLHDKLMISGARLAVETLHQIQQNQVNQIPQHTLINSNETLKKAPKIFKDDCKINWDQPTKPVYDFIRGLSPYPGAFTYISDNENITKLVKIYKASIKYNFNTYETHSLLTDGKHYLQIVCRDGTAEIKEIQMEGKKRMEISEFLKGFPIDENWVVKQANT